METIEIIFLVLWIIGGGIICFFPIHPLVNAIATVFGVIIPAIYWGFYFQDYEGADFIIRSGWVGWVIAILLTLFGLLCNIIFLGGDIVEEKTENGVTFLYFTGISCLTYALSFFGVMCLTFSILNVF